MIYAEFRQTDHAFYDPNIEVLMFAMFVALTKSLIFYTRILRVGSNSGLLLSFTIVTSWRDC